MALKIFIYIVEKFTKNNINCQLHKYKVIGQRKIPKGKLEVKNLT